MLNRRGLVPEKIRRAKKQAHLQAALAGKTPGSKRSRKVQRRRARLKAKSVRRVRDINQPTGIAAAEGRRAQRQRNGRRTVTSD